MRRRLLGLAVILLFLTSPLSALLCGDCFADHCAPGDMEPPASLETTTAPPHCQEMAAEHKMADREAMPEGLPADEEPAPAVADADSRGKVSLFSLADCCAMAATAKADSAAVPAPATCTDFVLQTAGGLDGEPASRGNAAAPRPKPPPPLLLALYTLHDTLLI